MRRAHLITWEADIKAPVVAASSSSTTPVCTGLGRSVCVTKAMFVWLAELSWLR